MQDIFSTLTQGMLKKMQPNVHQIIGELALQFYFSFSPSNQELTLPLKSRHGSKASSSL